MTWEEARAEFLKRKQAGEDILIKKNSVGPSTPTSNDFCIVDRKKELEESKKKETE